MIAFKAYDTLEDNLQDIKFLKENHDQNVNAIRKNTEDLDSIKATYMTTSFGLRDFDMVKSDIDSINRQLYAMNSKIDVLNAKMIKNDTNMKVLMGINHVK